MLQRKLRRRRDRELHAWRLLWGRLRDRMPGQQLRRLQHFRLPNQQPLWIPLQHHRQQLWILQRRRLHRRQLHSRQLHRMSGPLMAPAIS